MHYSQKSGEGELPAGYDSVFSRGPLSDQTCTLQVVFKGGVLFVDKLLELFSVGVAGTVEVAGILQELLIIGGVPCFFQGICHGVYGGIGRIGTTEDAAPGTNVGVDAQLAGALQIGQGGHAIFGNGDQRDDVAGLDEAHDLISTGDVDVDMAADHGTGQLRAGAVVDDLNVLLHFGNVTAKAACQGLLQSHRVRAGSGQHAAGQFLGMCLCVVHELGEVGVLAFLCLLGRGDDVDGVDQLCNGAQLFLEIHGQDLLQVQHDVGLGAQNVSITVSGLLAGKVDAVCAACTFDVDNLNRNTQDGLQHGLQGAQGAVSTAADAPGADQRDLALPFGSLRLKGKGSDAGHNGLKHIAATLGTQNYARLRFGIGNEFPKGGQIDYVLGKFNDDDMKLMPERLETAAEIIKSFCLAGLNITMNQFNNK